VDNQAITHLENNPVDPLMLIPSVSASDVGAPKAEKFLPSKRKGNNNTALLSKPLEGFKVTSLAKTRAIVAGPTGSLMVTDGQEMVINGALWRVQVRDNSVEFKGKETDVTLLFDRSLSVLDDNSSVISPSNDKRR
jgi:hypothetical protein